MKAVTASVRSSEASIPGVPGGDVVEALGDRPPLVGRQDGLGALHRQRGVGGDLGRQGPGRLQHAVGVGGHVVDQADLLGPLRADVLAGEGQLGHVARADDRGQPLQAAEVGHDRHLGLAHREDGVGRPEPDVTGGDEVHAAADAVAVDGGDDGLRAAATAVMAACSRRTSPGRPGPGGHGRGRPRPRPAGAGLAAAGEHAPHRLQVEAHREVRPLGRHDHGTHGGVGTDGGHGPGKVPPQVHAHGVAGLGSVEPHGGHELVLLDAQHRRRELAILPCPQANRRAWGPAGSPVGPLECMGCIRPDRAPERGLTLHPFSAEASAGLAGPAWLRERRTAGHEAFVSTPLPTETEEVWRYSPIDHLALDEFAPGSPRDRAPLGRAAEELRAAVEAALGTSAGSVLVHNGRPAPRHDGAAGVRLRAGRRPAGVARHAGVGADRRRRARAAERRLRPRPRLRRRAGRRDGGQAAAGRPLVRPGRGRLPAPRRAGRRGGHGAGRRGLRRRRGGGPLAGRAR